MVITWLLERMQAWQDKPALIWRDQPVSYGVLVELVSVWHKRLEASGVHPGQVVALEGDYSPQTVALLLALIERATIAVPLTQSVAAQRAAFMEIAEVQVVVTVDTADAWHIAHRHVAVTNLLTRQLMTKG